MVATTNLSDTRFATPVRVLHWVNATLFLILLFTAAALYVGPVSELVGRRELVKTIHVYTGLCLPIPLLIAAFGSAVFRAEAGRLNRWTAEDWKWLRRKKSVPGKYNAGQKLNAAFVAGAIPVMLATGSIMKWFSPFPLSWRTGSTFVHDVIAIVLFFVIVGHIAKALMEPDRLRAMVRGGPLRAGGRSATAGPRTPG
jgi:formate dehydrogenase subunit gamma